jgi:predicted Rossmann-fold nucleotide-binding protein
MQYFSVLYFYRPMIELLERSIERRFMDERHRAMWTLVAEPEQVLGAIRDSPSWPSKNRQFAAL